MIILKENGPAINEKTRNTLAERVAKLREAHVPSNFLRGLPVNISPVMKRFISDVATNGIWG
jgi:hypothetical protein